MLDVKIFPDKLALAKTAAKDAGVHIRGAIESRGRARIVAATGTSQIEFLDELTRTQGVDWRRVELFHLDEYIGLPIDHPASFRKYLLDRLIQPAGVGRYHLLDGERDARELCEDVGKALSAAPIDVAFVGIGENGHLAFNDPPADFDTDTPYIVVRLDEACRQQQVHEGWFASLADVPEFAISMSARQILKATAIICIAPERRKAEAVRASVEGPVTPNVPASILRTHPNVRFYLDQDSSALLGGGAGRDIPRKTDERSGRRYAKLWPIKESL
jgi:glucosamine-6-phosphate deaminase